ncbi:MAG TPA: hypothetical protein DIV54_02605, partial [Verrucomicrobiales bacterium]|nr:hypothetical protein [Verrucomicrobiales bacterium]
MELFDSIRRRRLTQQGHSSGKKRRTYADRALILRLDGSSGVRYGLYLLFTLFAASLAFNDSGATGQEEGVGTLFSFLVACGISLALFEILCRKVSGRNSHVFLVLLGFAFQLLL